MSLPPQTSPFFSCPSPSPSPFPLSARHVCSSPRRLKAVEFRLPSPWTAQRRRLYPGSLPPTIGAFSDDLRLLRNSSTFWWQLTRLYGSAHRSDDILGWLCDRWATANGQESSLCRLGSAVTSKGLRDYEGAFKGLSEVLADQMHAPTWLFSTNHTFFVSPAQLIIENRVDDDEEGPWTREELKLICREEMLQCLQRLGSWEDLDELATSESAWEDSGASAATSSSSTSNSGEISPRLPPNTPIPITPPQIRFLISDVLWNDADSLLPLIIHARLQICLSSCTDSGSFPSAFAAYREIMESGLRSSTSASFKVRPASKVKFDTCLNFGV